MVNASDGPITSSAWTPSYPFSPTRSGFISGPKLNRKRDGRNDEFPTNQDIGISYPDALKFKAHADACADLFNAKLANCRGGRVARRAKMASGKTPYNSRKTATPLRPTRPPLQRDCDKRKLVSRGPSRTGKRLDA